MSSIQPPPGWWLASDGRWYAPELHPDARASIPTSHQADQAAISQLPTSTHQDRPPDGRGALRSPWVWGTGLATVLALVVLVLVGSGGGNGNPTAAPRSGAGSARGGSSPAATTPVAASGAAPEPAAASAPTAPTPPVGPSNRAESVAGPAEGDVSVSQCVIDPGDARHAVVNGAVINHDTHTDDYTITVAIQQGGQNVGSAFVTDDRVAVGADAPWSALGTVSAGTGNDLTCSVTYVSRASA